MWHQGEGPAGSQRGDRTRKVLSPVPLARKPRSQVLLCLLGWGVSWKKDPHHTLQDWRVKLAS